jgi:hypothetical protein
MSLKPIVPHKTFFCKKHGETEYGWVRNSRYLLGGYWRCIKCNNIHKVAWSRSNGISRPMSESKESSAYLGIYVAEQVLSNLFDVMHRMPTNNTGYDYTCGRGFKIDVKSSCLCYVKKHSPKWNFNIDRNQVADYFLCISFDNRENLQPQHVWLIPSEVVFHLKILNISNCLKSLSKWTKYERPLDRVLSCCDEMRDRRNPET